MVARDGPSLLCHDWSSQVKLDWKQLHQLNCVKATPVCQKVLDKQTAGFWDKLGTAQGVKAKFYT